MTEPICLIKIRDDKHTLLNIKYKVPKDYRGKVGSGKQIFNNELYEKIPRYRQ